MIIQIGSSSKKRLLISGLTIDTIYFLENWSNTCIDLETMTLDDIEVRHVDGKWMCKNCNNSENFIATQSPQETHQNQSDLTFACLAKLGSSCVYFPPQRGIIVYNIFHISLSASVSDQATKKYELWMLKEHGTINCPSKLSPEWPGFENSKFYKECMCSLALLPPRLPPRNCTVCESHYLTQYYTQTAKRYHKLLLLMLVSSVIHSPRKVVL